LLKIREETNAVDRANAKTHKPIEMGVDLKIIDKEKDVNKAIKDKKIIYK